jgi:hypothetical protein
MTLLRTILFCLLCAPAFGQINYIADWGSSKYAGIAIYPQDGSENMVQVSAQMTVTSFDGTSVFTNSPVFGGNNRQLIPGSCIIPGTNYVVIQRVRYNYTTGLYITNNLYGMFINTNTY